MRVETVPASQLAARLADAEWCEAPLTEGISPCTIVEADRTCPVVIPASVPRVFVGRIADHALDCTATSDTDLDTIVATCSTRPRAATVLVQLLRVTETLSVEAALVAESFAYSALLGGPEFAQWRAARTVPSRPADTDPPVLLDATDDRLVVTLNRPAVHNAYDNTMRDALIDVLRAARTLPGAVELRGNGRSFCSGGDLRQFGTASDIVTAHHVRTARSPGLLLHALGSRATAFVHGSCVGAGVELAAFCARVTADPATTFRLPELSMGLIPGAGGTVSLPRRIGRDRTAWLALTGQTIDAPTAHAWGLVDSLR